MQEDRIEAIKADTVRQIRRDYWYDFRDGGTGQQCGELTDDQIWDLWSQAERESPSRLLAMRATVIACRAMILYLRRQVMERQANGGGDDGVSSGPQQAEGTG